LPRKACEHGIAVASSADKRVIADIAISPVRRRRQSTDKRRNLVALLKRNIMSDAHGMEFDMTIVTKLASIVTAAIIGISPGTPLPVPAFADPVSSSTTLPGHAPATFRRGDLVRLRSGGPAVDSIKGHQVDCFWTGEDGQPNAESFSVDVLQKF
jgi:uncharacterized protein YodC (DUF2158 family)